MGKACLVNLEGAVGKQRISRVGERLSQEAMCWETLCLGGKLGRIEPRLLKKTPET